MIKMMAKCDGPMCPTVLDVKGEEYPDAWTQITVERSRIQGLKTGEFGFCSSVCLSTWAGMYEHRVASK